MSCYGLNENPEHKQEICFARSFGRPLTAYTDLEEATVSYVAKIGSKLRKQKLLAGNLLVFIMTNKYADGPQYVNYKIIKLPNPGNYTPELIHYAIIALKKLFREGYSYKKSGIIVSEVMPATGQQTGLWDNTDRPKNKKLIEAIDKINEKAGIEKVKYAVQGDEEKWKMRQKKLSPHFTTKWSDILIVDIDQIYRK
jgi:DNA polymerase V